MSPAKELPPLCTRSGQLVAHPKSEMNQAKVAVIAFTLLAFVAATVCAAQGEELSVPRAYAKKRFLREATTPASAGTEGDSGSSESSEESSESNSTDTAKASTTGISSEKEKPSTTQKP
ncbi:hypothetical protein MRX96_047616 [Rhipicephalus microplus]